MHIAPMRNVQSEAQLRYFFYKLPRGMSCKHDAATVRFVVYFDARFFIYLSCMVNKCFVLLKGIVISTRMAIDIKRTLLGIIRCTIDHQFEFIQLLLP